MTGRPGDEGAISRRAALGVLGGAAAAVAAAVAGVRLVGDDDRPGDAGSPGGTEAPGGSAGARDELDGIRRIGEAYLTAHPEQAGREELLEALGGGQPGGVDPEAEPEEILAGLEAAIREDFAEARTVVLDGWHLSVTEARAAALVALG